MIWLDALGTTRIAAALLTILLFTTLCCATVARVRRRRRDERHLSESLLPTGDGALPVLVAHASQTGTAEQLAWQTARALQLAGVPTQVSSLSTLTLADLQHRERALFIVSTYGEGDPPDAAAPFVRRTMLARTGPLLGGLHFGVLALGDRTYDNYCGFGRTLDQWLSDQGAQALMPRVEADRVAESDIERWRQQLAHVAGTRDAPDWSGPEFGKWQLTSRVRLNTGSEGEVACHLELRPDGGQQLPPWEAGDLLQVRVPGETLPREYSIASIPADGAVHLLVRQARRADGSLGSASGWLLAGAETGAVLEARVREHRSFRLGDNARRPLILIGNGTGIAGLRALLKARAAREPASGADPRCWLLFGERSARHDAFYLDELMHWQRTGVLTRCDLVYSRDQPERQYVQHRLAEQRVAVLEWVQSGAAIYVCGSLKGMAAEVDAVLETTLGRHALDELTVTGRYRRDVY